MKLSPVGFKGLLILNKVVFGLDNDGLSPTNVVTYTLASPGNSFFVVIMSLNLPKSVVVEGVLVVPLVQVTSKKMMSVPIICLVPFNRNLNQTEYLMVQL